MNKGRGGKNRKNKGRGTQTGKGKGWRPQYGKGSKKGKMTANYVDTAYLADDYDYDYDYDCAYDADQTKSAELQNTRKPRIMQITKMKLSMLSPLKSRLS